MQNIALQLEYDGSKFNGFQKQSNLRTIQEELELALSKFADQKIQVITAGRTDTKVHALNQVINFTTSAKRELYGWVRGVNALLPDDIVIKQATVVAKDFNARFDALSRTYYYYLQISKIHSAILNNRVGYYHSNLDIPKMQEAVRVLLGKHDFSSFRAAGCQAVNPVREMSNCVVCICNMPLLFDNRDPIIKFEFTANAFLYHMVRNLVGALVYVGNGRLSVENFEHLLLAKDRRSAPPTFMPDGLYLARVEYANGLFDN